MNTIASAEGAAMVSAEDALAKRYRDGSDFGQSPWNQGPWNQILATLLGHKSVRAYLPGPLPEGALQTIVAAAQSAATSSNLQTWSVVSVTDAAAKARFAAIAGNQKHIEQCPVFLVFLADLSRLRHLAEVEGEPSGGLDYLESFLVAVIDAALAAQNAVVAAESMGLGTVYIGALRNNPQAVAEELGLPPEVLGVFGLCLGWPDPAGASDVKPRLSQDVVWHAERYRAPARPADIATYDDAMRAFQSEQGMPTVGWASTSLKRVRGPESLGGRDMLRNALAKLGFKLL